MANDTFIDFDLRIFKAGADTYLVTAQTPGSGLANGMLDWAALSDDDFTALVERIREEPFTADEALFRQVGGALFDALFRDQIRDLLISVYSQRVQTVEDTYLRLRLDINESAPEVAVLPWEFMHWNDAFLGTQVKTLFTRQLLNLDYGNIKTLAVAGKPRVLVVIPRGSGLATDVEEETISKALTRTGLPFQVLKGRVPVQRLDDTLAEGDFSILHFIGHGEFEEGDDGALHGSLRFNASWEEENEEADEEWVADTRLQALLGNHEDLKLVVLNACQGAQVAERRSGRGFIGTAPAILRARVPAVVAMQYAIRDDVALQFGETFYKRLTGGKWAGQVDTALTLARNACYLNFSSDRGFATPILYLRSKDGVIFELPDEAAQPVPDHGETEGEDPCPPPPRPGDELLHDHRYDDVKTMLASVKSNLEQINLVKRQIDQFERMKLQNPLLAAGGMADLQIQQLQEQGQRLEREAEEEEAVLRWKLHETCVERQEEAGNLAGLKAQKAELEGQNAYVPYSLKNDISASHRRLQELDDLLQQGARYR